MSALLSALLLVIMAISGLPSTDGQCDTDALMVCLQPLQQFGDVSAVGSGSITAAQLQSLCGAFGAVSTCARGATASCSQQAKVTWDVVDNAFAYLCGPGKQLYLDNAACLNNPTTVSSMKTCANSVSSQASPSMTAAELCNIINGAVRCAKTSASTCGPDAITLMGQLMEEILMPTRNAINCPSGVGRLWHTCWVMLLAVAASFYRLM